MWKTRQNNKLKNNNYQPIERKKEGNNTLKNAKLDFLVNSCLNVTCHKRELIESENPNVSLMNVNTATVTAVVNSRQGFAQLETFATIMNMPNMSNKLYQKLHEKVYKFTSKTAWEAMSLVGEEEAKLVTANGNIREGGVLMITIYSHC